jgi:hypothetical protein
VFPPKGKDKRKEGLNRKTEYGPRLRHKDDLLFEEDRLEDADDALQGQKFEYAVNCAFLDGAKGTETMG